jgi:hypothetical protein
VGGLAFTLPDTIRLLAEYRAVRDATFAFFRPLEVGTSIYPVRFRVPPEVVLLTISGPELTQVMVEMFVRQLAPFLARHPAEERVRLAAGR